MHKLISLFLVLFASLSVQAQCSICTKTAGQLGEEPASALNSGIVYLMITPLAIFFFLGWRWWKREKGFLQAEREGRAIHQHEL
jgi:hypothetical protein